MLQHVHDHTHVAAASPTVGDFFSRLFDTDFMQRGECVSWRPEVVWLHVVSDGLIMLAYYSIPLALLYFVRRRKDLAFHWMFLMFAAFILACGTTHLMGLIAFWFPLYRLDGVIKAGTALLSIATAAALWPLIPKALALPSPSDLRTANRNLEREVGERTRAQEELRRAHERLEEKVRERTAELERVNQLLVAEVEERRRVAATLKASEEKLRVALRISPIVLFQQDRSLRYTWIANTRTGRTEADYLGKTDSDLVSPEDAENLAAIKGRVLNDGQSIQEEVEIRLQGEPRCFEITAEPLRDSLGSIIGLTGAALEITERKRVEHHTSFLLAELDHRVKNTLSVVLAIAEQSLQTVSTLDEFRESFTGRVRALAKTHSALAAARWRGVQLSDLIRLVLEPHTMNSARRSEVSGEPVVLSARAASSMCMLLNELTTNAAKYGAFSAPSGGNGNGAAGTVAIHWTIEPEEGGVRWLRIAWVESGGPPVRAPDKEGFGSELIRGAAVYEMGGQVSFDYPETGARCTVRIPLNEQNTSRGRFEPATDDPTATGRKVR